MQVYLISLLFVISSFPGKTPNFYPNFIAAREASKNYNKDLLIFFSKKTCVACDEAWGNFEKDPIASKLYISTSINIQDFDGAVMLDKYGLGNAPAWVLLDPQGQVKDKWEGEWKKTPTRPSTPKPEAASTPAPTGTPAQVTPEKSVTQTKPAAETQQAEEKPVVTKEEVQTVVTKETSPIETQTKEEVISTPKPPVTTPVISSAITGDYFIQAGYFGSEANAGNLLNQLSEKGYDHFSIKTVERDGKTFYRVISESFTSETDAAEVVQNMLQSDIKATIKSAKEIAN